MINTIILAAAYLTGAVGIWRMGPLTEFDIMGERELSLAGRLLACAIWPITLMQMWEP